MHTDHSKPEPSRGPTRRSHTAASAPLVGLALLATAGTTSRRTIVLAFVGALVVVIAVREAIVRAIRHRHRTSARGRAQDGRAGRDVG